jgi:hypothetical protein
VLHHLSHALSKNLREVLGYLAMGGLRAFLLSIVSLVAEISSMYLHTCLVG